MRLFLFSAAIGAVGPAHGQSASSGAAVELAPIEVQGTGAAAGPIAADGYVAKSSAVGSKTDTPLTEIPQSISTITRQQLDDRHVQTLNDAVLYSSGVRVGTSGFDPRFDSFYVRGFDATYTGVYRDGLREQNGNFSIFKTETYGLEGVSILKGPASALYGGGSPGGIIDLTTKRPTFTPIGEVGAEIGNRDRYQGEFDVGGPVNGSDEFAYRLTGLARNSDTQLMGMKDDKVYIAPAFTWKPNDDTTFTLLAEYSHIKTGGNTSYYMDETPDGKRRITNYYSGDPAFNDFIQDQYRLGYAFEHKFTDNVTFRQNLRYAHIDARAEYVDIDEGAITPGATSAARSAGLIIDHINTLALDNQVQANVTTGPFAHTLVAGLDVQYANGTDKFADGAAPDLDLTTLNYGDQHIPAPDDFSGDNTRQRQRQIGVYLQDQIKLGPFIATLGLRNDWARTLTTNRATGDTSPAQTDHKLSGRAGLTYVGPYGLSPYVSYSTSFTPTLGTDAETGKPFVPTTGEQYEAGVKYAPPGYNALITGAVFDITQQNVLRADPDIENRQIQTGEMRSRGFELEATGSLDNGLSFTASYTHLNLEIVKGEAGTDGKAPSGIPRNSAALWADYVFRPGAALEGLTVGAGLRYNGRSFGDDQNTFRNKAAVFVDSGLKLEMDRFDPRLKGLKLRVDARNLFDKKTVACQSGYCYRGDRRTVIAGLSYAW